MADAAATVERASSSSKKKKLKTSTAENATTGEPKAATLSSSDNTSNGTATKPSKQSQVKQLTADLAAAKEEIAKLTKQNEELLEELETLRGVLSVHAQQKLETTKKRVKKQQTGGPIDDGEAEFDDDASLETFNKAAASDDTTIKRSHHRAKSITSSIAPSELRQTTTGDNLTVSNPGGRTSKSPSRKPSAEGSAASPALATTSDAKSTRPSRPGASNPRKPKYSTASNLSKTIISREDETELLGGSDHSADRKVIIDSLNLVGGGSASSSPTSPTTRSSESSKRATVAATPILAPTPAIVVAGTKAPPPSLNASSNSNPDTSESASSSATPSTDDHPQIFDENTVLDILCGLGITSSRQFEEDEMHTLTPKDYSYSYQFKVRRTSDQLLKFKDFAPKVFHQIRKHFNVSEAELLFSFRYDNLDAFPGAGKSGAFFIFTRDRRFILKTATKEERDFLWEILPYYLQHIRKNPNTLLPRFYGVYSMKHEGIGGVVRFVIMNNWFSSIYDPVEKYDLKGSTVGRTVGETQKSGSILKDLDIKRKFYFPTDLKKQIVEQLKLDSAFLSTHNVMDYSLLVGVYYDNGEKAQRDGIAKRREQQKRTPEDYSFKSIYQSYENGTKAFNYEADREEVYFCGIIDVLQRYNAAKKFEHFFKSIPYKAGEISIVAPSYYSRRFYEFVSDKFTADTPSSPTAATAPVPLPDKLRESKKQGDSGKGEDKDAPRKATSQTTTTTTKKSKREDKNVRESGGRKNKQPTIEESDEEDPRGRSNTVV